MVKSVCKTLIIIWKIYDYYDFQCSRAVKHSHRPSNLSHRMARITKHSSSNWQKHRNTQSFNWMWNSLAIYRAHCKVFTKLATMTSTTPKSKRFVSFNWISFFYLKEKRVNNCDLACACERVIIDLNTKGSCLCPKSNGYSYSFWMYDSFCFFFFCNF